MPAASWSVFLTCTFAAVSHLSMRGEPHGTTSLVQCSALSPLVASLRGHCQLEHVLDMAPVSLFGLHQSRSRTFGTPDVLVTPRFAPTPTHCGSCGTRTHLETSCLDAFRTTSFQRRVHPCRTWHLFRDRFVSLAPPRPGRREPPSSMLGAARGGTRFFLLKEFQSQRSFGLSR